MVRKPPIPAPALAPRLAPKPAPKPADPQAARVAASLRASRLARAARLSKPKATLADPQTARVAASLRASRLNRDRLAGRQGLYAAPAVLHADPRGAKILLDLPHISPVPRDDAHGAGDAASRAARGLSDKRTFSLIYNPGVAVEADTPYGNFTLATGKTLVPKMAADVIVGADDSNAGTLSKRGICRIYPDSHPKAYLNAGLKEQAAGRR